MDEAGINLFYFQTRGGIEMGKKLSDIQVAKLVAPRTFQRGKSYFDKGRVRGLIFDRGRGEWSATVRGTSSYLVKIIEVGGGFDTECTCPFFQEHRDHCKHIVAVLLKIQSSVEETGNRAKIEREEAERRRQEEQRRRQEIKRREQEERQARLVKEMTTEFIQRLGKRFEKNSVKEKGPWKQLNVEWTLKIEYKYYTGNPFLYIEMKVGEKRTLLVKKMKEFLKALEAGVSYHFSRSFTYEPNEHFFSEKDQEIIEILQLAAKYEGMYYELNSRGYYHGSVPDDRLLMVPAAISDKLLEKLADEPISFQNDIVCFKGFSFYDGKLPVGIRLKKGKSGTFQLDLAEFAKYKVLDLYGYLVRGNAIYRLGDEMRQLFSDFVDILEVTESTALPIEDDLIEPFISIAAPELMRLGALTIEEEVSKKIVNYPLKAKIFVDMEDGALTVSPEFHYGNYKISPLSQTGDARTLDGPIFIRDTEKEREVMELLTSSSLTAKGTVLYSGEEEAMFTFLYEDLPLLKEEADVYTTAAVKALFLENTPSPVTNITVGEGGNWLDVQFDIDGINQEDIKDILLHAIEKKRYYRLPDGAFIPLDTDGFQAIQSIFEELELGPSQLKDRAIKLPLNRGVQLNDLIESDGGRHARLGKPFRRFLNRLKNPEGQEYELPAGLEAVLRDYQEYGFQWMKTLGHYKFGGILADDMGLGKTIQCIAFILSEKETKKDAGPSLVVAPASLVYNWRNEIRKFAPSLKTEVLAGTPQERSEFLKSSEGADILITSYPTLRRDIEFYRENDFHILILDEAQAVKNYATKASRAVREVKADIRFALSGTPIENSIDELWAIFQAVMPGFFPSQASFRKIEPEKIAKMIRPFLLRRVKKDVLKELPEKVETILYSELTKEQKTVYLAYLERIKKETAESLQAEGFGKNRIKILAGLTRLRQLCCHPALFLENYKGDSGKLQQLVEFVGNAIENGRRLLIFSQFTSMLAIIRENLEEAGIGLFYLDGQTAPKERVEMADRFNNGEKDVFLISLKAGNTGLNLTGADTVILYDLWWNPAVEEQAAGRAHRIGQKNVVQVIRMVSEGTIEEKIYNLQQNKKELIETVIQPGDSAAAVISEQEIREILSLN